MNPNTAVTGMGQFMDDGINHPLYWTTVTAPGTALKFIAAYKEMRPNSAGINGGIIGTARYASNNSPQAVYWSDTQTVYALDDIVKDNTAVLKYGNCSVRGQIGCGTGNLAIRRLCNALLAPLTSWSTIALIIGRLDRPPCGSQPRLSASYREVGAPLNPETFSEARS